MADNNLVTQLEGVHIRPEVAKHYELFVGYTKEHGADTIRELLQKGRSGRYKLTVMKNRKDRYQMMQLLDLVGVKPCMIE